MENKNLERLQKLKDMVEEVSNADTKDELKSISKNELASEFDYLELRLFKGLKNYIDNIISPIFARLTRIETKQHELLEKVDKLIKTLGVDKKQEEIAEYIGKLKELLGESEK